MGHLSKTKGGSVKVRPGKWFIWVLLGVLLSYNLDLECFLEGESGCQLLCQEATEDLCLEPALSAGPPPTLPVRYFVLQVYPTEVDPEFTFLDYEWALPRSQMASLPVGLRAPPAQA